MICLFAKYSVKRNNLVLAILYLLDLQEKKENTCNCLESNNV